MCYVHFDCTHDAQLKNLKHCVYFCEYSVQIYVRHVVWNGKLSDREKPQRRKRMRTIYSSGYETGLTAFQVMCTVDDKLSMRWMHLAFLSKENFNDVFLKRIFATLFSMVHWTLLHSFHSSSSHFGEFWLRGFFSRHSSIWIQIKTVFVWSTLTTF